MKKGFTLIELLAVIVILAIIAVIAVPIVINIIDESKENATLRSAEMYMDAVELSVADRVMHHGAIPNKVYHILESGNICLETYNQTTKKCEDKDDNDKNNELVIEVKGEHPKEGTITIKDGEILYSEIKLNEKEIIKDSKGEIAYAKTLDEVCKYIKEDNTTPKTAGAKYECKVKETMEEDYKDGYTFYVLTTPTSGDKSINLIMERNINSDGTPVTKAITKEESSQNNGVYNLVEWISKEDYISNDGKEEDWNSICIEDDCGNNSKGPITAMNFLQEATKTWTNVNEMIIDSFDSYNDEEKYIDTYNIPTYNTYARMPYKTELNEYDDYDDNPNKFLYLYEYLDQDFWDATRPVTPTNEIDNIYGYWTLSSYFLEDEQNLAWHTSFSGELGADIVSWNNRIGVRPVISLNL